MNPVTINRRRFVRTYRHVAFTLQLFCCLATTATFLRVLHQHQLPLVFLVLPCLLFVILMIDRCIPFHDRYIISIFTGATTGFISGFISNVVVNLSDDAVYSFLQHRYVMLFCMLEFLHLPVVGGVVTYSFCLVFSRPPPLNIVILSFAVATCGMVIFNVASMMLFEPEKTDEIGIGKTASVLVFLLIFFMALLPVVRSNKRAWIICASGFAASIYWQAGFFDTVQWNWETSSFPIPGFLTGLVTLFMLDVADLREAEDKPRPRRANEHENYEVESQSEMTRTSSDGNNIVTALTWHSFSYVVERTSLTYIMQSRGHKGQGSDTWLSCFAMLGVLAVLTSERQFSLTVRLIILLLGLILYVSVTVTSGHLSNGYFLDDVFGLAFLTTAVTSDHIAL